MAIKKHEREKRGETVYSAVYLGPDGHRVSEIVRVVETDASEKKHEDAELAARAHARAQRRAIANGEWKDPREQRAAKKKAEALSFEGLVKRFLRDYRTRSGDMAYYQSRSGLWLAYPGFKRKAAREITTADVERFRNAREKGALPKPYNRPVGASTVRKDLVALGTVFRWAKGRCLVVNNPAEPERVRRPSEPPPRTDYLSRGEEEDLLKALPGWLVPVVRWCVETGMDKGEVLGLTTREVDLTAGIVYAPRSKTNAPRTIPISPAMAEILGEALKVRQIRPEAPEPVFLKDGGQINSSAADTALKRAYRAAEVRKPGPWKILRHTFGARSAMAGLTQPEIQHLMGHRNPVTTSRYTAFSPDHLRAAMRRRSSWEELHPELHQVSEKGGSVAAGDQSDGLN